MSTEYTDKEIMEIGRQVKYYNDELGMRWCKMERLLKMEAAELKRILCLYNERLIKEHNDGEKSNKI